MTAKKLEFEYTERKIQDLLRMHEQGELNLEPGFQRQSVWSKKDRQKLIQSLFENYPIPSVFLYEREENGRHVYDVLDGKQRLESIFMFAGSGRFGRQVFDVKFAFDAESSGETWSWKALEKSGRSAALLGYKIQLVYVRGDLPEIIDLFVRINSTGKALTAAEKRKAKYYNSPLLKEAARLAQKNRNYLLEERIVSRAGAERMRDVELVSELLVSLMEGGPIQKKRAVDQAIGNSRVNAGALKRASGEFTTTLNLVKRLFPELKATRFHNQAEFYTLFMVVHGLFKAKMILTDKKRNAAAMEMLRRFSNGVDALRDQVRQGKGAKPDQRLFQDYMMLVQQSTDALLHRKERARMLNGLLEGLFEQKDSRRVFSVVQRRLLWNSEEARVCSQCETPLAWSNFHVDHVKAHSRGGRTSLENAALICGPCNSSKGARRQATRRPHAGGR